MNVDFPSQYFKTYSTNSFVASAFLDGNTLMDSTSTVPRPINVHGCVGPVLKPLTFTQASSKATSLLGILGGLMRILSLSR